MEEGERRLKRETGRAKERGRVKERREEKRREHVLSTASLTCVATQPTGKYHPRLHFVSFERRERERSWRGRGRGREREREGESRREKERRREENMYSPLPPPLVLPCSRVENIILDFTLYLVRREREGYRRGRERKRGRGGERRRTEENTSSLACVAT
jgi:hypothetical protein